MTDRALALPGMSREGPGHIVRAGAAGVNVCADRQFLGGQIRLGAVINDNKECLLR